MVRDPANPTSKEVFDWAYSSEIEPDQNWELFLIWKADFESYLNFASDINCPTENFFLNLLYYWVWRSLKHELSQTDLSNYKSVFEKAERINTPYVRIWLTRTKELIVNNEAFTEEQWYSGRRPYDPTP